jgi:hypothetical protein
MNDVTRILSSIEQGDPQAAEQLLPVVYDELRRLAAQKLAREPSGLTGDQAAGALGISPRAADSLRAYARAWLFERMHPDGR